MNTLVISGLNITSTQHNSPHSNKPWLFSNNLMHYVLNCKLLGATPGGDQGSLLPRSMLLGVPDFTGTYPYSWLFPIDEYFSLLNMLIDQRLRIMCFNLEGVAAEWFRWMTQNNLITDWDRSTHNFVQPEVLEKMKLPITTMNQFKVYIGSGETLLCENLCSRVKLDIQGLSMEVDLYVLSMKGSDIMLKIQWLQKLGKVTHEYLQQTMEFILGETRYTLQWDESLRIKRISLRHM
uniref:Uncharacterized protein n=1 Tax=Tanacetum cinerariifolium TaxID=118510 RepID=A0A6L2N7D4_TANCI|nr:hypothetical protein [Tanacetum cinerariifolium]